MAQRPPESLARIRHGF